MWEVGTFGCHFDGLSEIHKARNKRKREGGRKGGKEGQERTVIIMFPAVVVPSLPLFLAFLPQRLVGGGSTVACC